MRTSESTFYVFRYSLVEEKQETLIPVKLPAIKGDAIKVAVTDDREWMDKNVKFSFVGFSDSIRRDSKETNKRSSILIGKLARLKKTNVGEKIPGDIVNSVEDDWIPVIVIFDTVEQLIFVQKSSKFGDVKYIAKKLQKGLFDPILLNYNYRVFVEPIPVKGEFWHAVNKYNRIYELNLILISPNILETNKKARSALEALHSLYSQDKTEIKMKSESGNLKIPELPTEDYVEYIEEGEGEWKLKVNDNGVRKIISSASLTETIELPVHKNVNEVLLNSQYELDVQEVQDYDNVQSRVATKLTDRILDFIKRRHD